MVVKSMPSQSPPHIHTLQRTSSALAPLRAGVGVGVGSRGEQVTELLVVPQDRGLRLRQRPRRPRWED